MLSKFTRTFGGFLLLSIFIVSTIILSGCVGQEVQPETMKTPTKTTTTPPPPPPTTTTTTTTPSPPSPTTTTTTTTPSPPPPITTTTPPRTAVGPIPTVGSARILIQIFSTSDHTSVIFLGEETLEELHKSVLEGADLIAIGHQSVDEKSVSFGSAENIQARRLIRLQYTIRLLNLEMDTEIPLRLNMGCIGWSNVEFYNYNLANPILVDERNTTICDGVDYSLSDNAFLTIPVTTTTPPPVTTTTTELPLGPVLTGSAAPDGTVTLIWDYEFPGLLGSSNDGYELVESTTESGPFSLLYSTVFTGDHREHVEYSITRPTGDYWYRVRARIPAGYTDYSNILYIRVQLSATTTPPETTTTPVTTPTTLRIINNLYDQTDQYGNDWGKLNGIIRVRIGSSLDDVIYSPAGEQLYPGEATDDVANLEIIPPAYNQMTSYRDFDVSSVSLAPDGSYYVFIQVGWWDMVFDPFTFQFLFWEKRNSAVLDCYFECCIEKWAVVQIIPPYFNPEEIRASDHLPHMHWNGYPTCPAMAYIASNMAIVALKSGRQRELFLRAVYQS